MALDYRSALLAARTLTQVGEIVRSAARAVTDADGATIVLRDGELCFYADEDAIAPLWKGQRFPMTECISGWVADAAAAAIGRIGLADAPWAPNFRVPGASQRPAVLAD
jgi:hypothetical protein